MKLRKHDFHRVIADQPTLSQQVAVFRDSELILTPHGAALTLLFCCRPGTRLFELMPSFEERTCFCDLASQFSLPYGRIICSTHQRQNKRRREVDLIFPLATTSPFFGMHEN